jgi:putative FmdB family regulatory protein
MPIYEYFCKSCDKTFESFQKITDKPLANCPECGKKVKRLISSTSFALKGGGWYKDGYSKGKGNGKAKVEAKVKPKSEKK